MKAKIIDGPAEPLPKQDHTKEKLFLLSWRDMDQRTKDLIIDITTAVFIGADTDRLYYDLYNVRPWFETRITKSKVYRLLRFILETTPRTIYNKLSGRADFTLSEMLRIMAAFDITTLDQINYLIEELRKGFIINE